MNTSNVTTGSSLVEVELGRNPPRPERRPRSDNRAAVKVLKYEPSVGRRHHPYESGAAADYRHFAPRRDDFIIRVYGLDDGNGVAVIFRQNV
ncbi:MAG: hypothetical protein R3337_03485, partial [Gammaproteobacteria bacterium]|nr:hypothetical protein [Gammaproteobacteria bacterium]